MLTALTIALLPLGVALGAGLAWLLLRHGDHASGQSLLVFFACMAAGGASMHFVVTPAVTEAIAARQARAELLAMPIYREIEKVEPDVFARLLSEYVLVVRDRSRLPDYTQLANSEIATVATRHIARASDAALLALMHDMLDKLHVLRARSADDCYKYLFPGAAGAADLARWFDRDSQSRTLARMADVIRTSAEEPVAVPARDRVEGLLSPIVNEMYAQYGENTALLARAEEPGVNRATVCSIATTLYEKVMRLPPADAAAVIRSMTQM
jgi:hypothetical protein